MQVFVDVGFQGGAFQWLNIIWMIIKAITQDGISTVDDLSITLQAYLICQYNDIRDYFDWPRFPPEAWSPQFCQLVEPSSAIIIPQSVWRSWFLGSATLGYALLLLDRLVLLKYISYFSAPEDRVYCRTGANWAFCVSKGRGKYSVTAARALSEPDSASQLVTFTAKGIIVKTEYLTPCWSSQQPDLDPSDCHHLEEPHPCIRDAFDDLIQAPHILLDQYQLSLDNCAIITQALWRWWSSSGQWWFFWWVSSDYCICFNCCSLSRSRCSSSRGN